MIRREDRTGGRRPLLVTFVGNNRQMLNEIRDSLSHLRKNDLDLCNDLSGLQLKPELSQSTPNLPEKSTGSKMTRRDNQHHKTLAEIRDSLRPYAATTSNGPLPVGGCVVSGNANGGGGGSDSSSTASSSSSHTMSDPDVNQSMVQDITRHGFDADIAVKALKLSGNQSADAALRLLYHIVEKINNGRHPAGMPNYQAINHRPSFGPNSPVTSDASLARSDSPSLNLNAQRHPASNGGQAQPPPLPPRVPITTPTQSSNTPRGLTPPPSAAGLDGVVKPSSLIAQQSLPGQATNISNLSPSSQTSKGKGVNHTAGLLAPSPMLDQPADIPQGRVKQLIQRISPLQNYYQLHSKQTPQPQSPHSQSNGGSNTPTTILSHRGVSPVTGNPSVSVHQQQQPLILGGGNNSTSSTPAPSPLLIQNIILNAHQVSATSSSSPSPAPSSSNGSPGLQTTFSPQGPPPPYSQAQAQFQARYGVQCHIESQQQQQQHHQHHTQAELSRLSPMSTTSDGPQQQLQKKLVANKAVSATRRHMDSSHRPVIMKSVKSEKVQKPMPQTATTPVIPPTQNGNNNNGMSNSSSPGFASPVTAHPVSLAGQQHLQQQQQHQPVLSAAFSISATTRTAISAKRDVGTPVNHHSQSHYQHQHHLLRNGNFTAEQLAAVSAASTGQPTILTTRMNAYHNQNHHHQHHHHQQHHHSNLKYGQFHPDTAMSTPRSDSPVSRATNQSPLSVLSTTSSPSTNSDIPDKLPPPYPGRGMGGPPPLLPPRIPITTKPPTPPPPNEQDQLLHNSQMPSKLPPSHLPSAFPPVSSPSSSSSPSPSSPGNLLMANGQSPHVPIPGPRSAVMPQPSTMPTPTNLQQCDPNSPLGLMLGNLRPSPALTNGPSSETEETDTDTSSVSQGGGGHGLVPPSKGSSNNQEKHRCMSPLPERKSEAKERDKLRCDTKVRNYSPQAFKFFMEQHIENLLKSHHERVNRKLQLEKEMAKAKLSEEAAQQMRKMLHQKESNYIRLKRAKMDSSMFEKIKTLGVGAFGEVALVQKKDINQLYAMKTLQKTNVIQRNQVAHVKAERDILAEADNEWVVKLYYSFQDRDNLYFVMDYVPGGDLMGLLIRKEILEEPLARFYIAELVLAIESVHRMGFIHRDIKPDNILIDQDGHIKLTDFGLCTGFRWTHNSKYYQKDGSHARQDSMEVNLCQLDEKCRCEILKPLEQRRQREQKRCLAHSLVGTPNYIAPEVLQRQGYTKACDWWSVGVILYEMVIGSPPFYASTPAETQHKVINWKETLTIRHDANISSSTSDLIFKLLRGSESRLGIEGATEVKKHTFFHGINFEGLRRQPAPFKPLIRSRTDTSNFDPVDPDKLHTNDSDCSKKFDSKLENGKHPEHAFYEFTFRRFFDDGGPSSLPSYHPDQETNSPVFV